MDISNNLSLQEKMAIKPNLEQKIFNHDLISLTPLERKNFDGVRHYFIPESNIWVPSVTSVLDKTLDKEYLTKWRKAVGEEEADLVSKRASTRGNNLHKHLEDYCLNIFPDIKVPSNKLLFTQAKKVLDRHCDNIRAIEGKLYSRCLKIAGTCDLICEYDGRPAIIDFKTARSIKYANDIKGYFFQVSLYSYMLWEVYGVSCKDIVIIIMNDDTLEAQVYKEKAKNYIEEAASLCKQYYKNYNLPGE